VRSFDAENPETVLKVVQEHWDTDPAILKMRRDFPEATPHDYIADLDQKLVNFDDKGVASTLRQAYRDLYKESPERAIEAWENKVVLQAWGDANRTLMDDIRKVHYGNPDRTNVERFLNSYLLYWPLSYQIKVGKWVVRMLTERAFGQNTNLAAAFKYNEVREMFVDEMSTNQDFAQFMQGNEHIFQAAMMMFPITPEDLGVNLSRPFRLFGSFLGIFEPMRGRDDPAAWASYIMEIGPIYTYKLLSDLSSDWEPQTQEEPSGLLFGPRGVFGSPVGTEPNPDGPIPTFSIGGQPIMSPTPITSPLNTLGG